MCASNQTLQRTLSAFWFGSLGFYAVMGEHCQPQGLLRLDTPYKRPGKPEILLPFCSEHNGCTCCNASHVLTMKKSLAGAMADKSIPKKCRTLTASFTCRACDPMVGVGWKPLVCQAFCDAWYSSCADSYFEYDPFTGLLLLAPQDSQRSLVSGKLQVLVTNGADMCMQAGAQVGQRSRSGGQDCWDGATGQLPSGLCTSVATRFTAEGNGGRSQYDAWGMLSQGFVLFLMFCVVKAVLRCYQRVRDGNHHTYPGKASYAK